MTETHGMNETEGRSGEYEPNPVSIDVVFCFLSNKRVSVTQARASYTVHNEVCIECDACQ